MKLLKIFLILIFYLQLNAQTDKSIYYDSGRQLYYDIFQYDSGNSDSTNYNVQFRISWNMLNFIKSTKSETDNKLLTAFYNFEVEFRDTNGIIRKRIVNYDTLTTNDYTEINRKDKYVHQMVSVKLPKGKYYPFIRIFDNDRTKLGEEKLKKIKLVNDSSLGDFSSCVFAFSDGDNKFEQYVLNGSAGFSSNDIKLLFQILNPSSKIYNYKIDFLDSNNSPIAFPDNELDKGNVNLIDNSALNIQAENKNRSIVEIVPEKNDAVKQGVLIFTIPGDRNIPGMYRLRIWDDKHRDSIKFEFSVVWENMPAYLLDPSKAVEIMYYVLKDSEYDKMKSGSNKEKLRKIFEWWKPKDPTKFSVYNEAMVEYFRRAEFSFKNFRTNFEKDGALTDRGKIYILNGPPDNSLNQMQYSGQNIEEWNYRRLNKKFVFQSDKNGIIYLKEIKPY